MRVTLRGPNVEQDLHIEVDVGDNVHARVLSALGLEASPGAGFAVVFGETEVSEEATFLDHDVEDGARLEVVIPPPPQSTFHSVFQELSLIIEQDCGDARAGPWHYHHKQG